MRESYSNWRETAPEEHILKNQGKAWEDLTILLLLLTKQEQSLYTFKCPALLTYCAFYWPAYKSSPNSTHQRYPQNSHRHGATSGHYQDLDMKQLYQCPKLTSHILTGVHQPSTPTQSNRRRVTDPLMSEKLIIEVNLT